MLNGLDLFSGIGGISLALQPWVRTVCYVEIEPYCRRVLAERMRAGDLDEAPVWDDVRSFDPRPWRGAVDIVSGGFPCQDISTAGRGAGLAGERSGLFREIVRIAGDLRPRFIFLENVAAITASGLGGWDVVGALAALGYDARWGVLSAFDVGAPHLRERWWCLAHAAGHDGRLQPGPRRKGQGAPEPFRDGEAVAHATGGGAAASQQPGRGCEPEQSRRALPDRNGPRLAQREGCHAGGARPDVGAVIGGAESWAVEPGVGRVADGVPARVDRLRGLGNAVVPACAREAFRRLLAGGGVTP